jgi:hypothetical protein
MGGRGSASGISVKGIKYGTEFSTVLASGNLKFVKYEAGNNAKSPLETMSASKDRVYVVTKGDVLKSVVFYDNQGKRNRQIDLDHDHYGVVPHVHPGYDLQHQESDADIKLTKSDKMYINKVRKLWKEYKK